MRRLIMVWGFICVMLLGFAAIGCEGEKKPTTLPKPVQVVKPGKTTTQPGAATETAPAKTM